MTKVGILGDLHLRSSKPINRIDDYYMKQFKKLKQAFETFKNNDCLLVLQPGDFFNNYGNDPYNIVYDTIAFLMLYRIPIYLVFGQHDIKFHNTNLTDIPIQILNKTDLVTKLDKDPTVIKLTYNRELHLYGCDWNKEIPKVEKEDGIFKVLIIHEMIIKGKKLWPGQTDFVQARQLSKYGFDLIVAGDNHQAFVHNDMLINCGSLMRMNIDQTEHEPMFGIYDLEEHTLETYKYDIEASHDVLREQEVKQKKADDKRKDEFSEKLNSDFEGELDFRANINTVIKNKHIRKRTKNIIEDSLNQK